MISGDIWHKHHEGISKLLNVISRVDSRAKFETIWNIASGIYAKYHVQIKLLFVYTTTPQKVCNFYM